MTGQIRAASIACLLWLCLSAALAAEAGTQDLGDPQSVQLAVDGLAWMPEGDLRAEILPMLKGGFEDRFQPSPDGTVPLSGGPVWLRVRVRDTSGQDAAWSLLLDEWAIRDIHLYRPTGRGDWEAVRSGTDVPESQRERPGRVYQFHLAAGGQALRGTHTVYLRVDAPHSSARLPVWLGTAPRLEARSGLTDLGYAMLGGAYALLVAVCLVLFLAVIERVYAVMLVFSVLILASYLILTGLLGRLVGPAACERLLLYLPELTLVYLACSLILLLWWLKSGDILPRAWRVAWIFIGVLAAAAVLLATLPADALFRIKAPVMFGMLLAGAGFRLAIPVLAIAKGRRVALVYLVAFLFEIGGTGLYALRSTGLVPNDSWLTLAAQSGGALQLLTMLYGATLQVRQLRSQLVQSNRRLSGLNQELEERVHQQTADLEQERNKLAKLAMEDDLTGLQSRRAIMARVESEHQRYSRYGKPYSLLMIDLDHFKLVNDTWGHGVGDQVLKGLADVLCASLRATDQAGRVGGEEFLVLLPETGADQALAVSEKIRDRLADIDFEGRPDRRFMVSCSIGVAEIRPGHPGWHRLMQDADAALYEAKEAGRNRTVVSRR
jgi:diguanylate cyclase (GGDEF)-like protein